MSAHLPPTAPGTPDGDMHYHCSELFMVRLWPEDLGGGQIEWRGHAQHVNSGEVRYFREWSALQDFLALFCLNQDPTA
jgi:hypothetical protein